MLGALRLPPPCPSPSLNDGQGGIAVRFVGRWARRQTVVPVGVGWETWRYRTDHIDVLALDAGVWPILVAQTRVGVNAGAVLVITGLVTVLDYRSMCSGRQVASS